ncbi:transglycosylase SLT domain-containing protein [Proteobacteria bacterium 005FR1]|nr:transglycosylase SLT domain-containing protein [Proteobacteria bacterium 005FR1]
MQRLDVKFSFGVLAGFLLALGAGASQAQGPNTSASAAVISSVSPSAPSPSQLQLQRNQFMAAEDALRQQRFTTFKQLVAKLGDYPLTPYLEYSELHRRLYLFPADEVEQFMGANAGSYLGDLMAREWLETLAKQRKWEDYKMYFPRANLDSADLRCYYLRARFNTGDETALESVAELWNVGHSQPDACDPLFKVWIERGFLTDEIAWERHSKAIAKRNLSLSRYVAGKMSAETRKLADLYYEVDRHPERLKNHQRFSKQSPQMHEIILHGIRRYVRKDPLEALTHWRRYDAQHYFPAEDRSRTQEYLVTHLAVEGHIGAAEQVLDQGGEITSTELIAWLVRDALRSQDWQRAYDSIRMLPSEEQQNERWLYWRARALEQLGVDDPDYPSAEQIYASLALTRTFYGFLSADLLGHEYSLVDKPVNPSIEHLDLIKNLPAMRRAKELLDLGRSVQARREWFYATRGLDPAQLLAAGKLAEEWGWYRKSIQAMIEANYWDDLQLRFPLAYLEEMNSASASTNVEPTFLYAIARQESAFAADARSPAGAMGLMQLLPSTAKRTAQKIGMKYSYWDLINPSQNIQLGSRYLDQLLEQFNGNRVLAAAAYNAGPYRVKKWLAETDKQLPYDIWIETIPFWETRGYVQNVLAYSVIYGYRMGKQVPILGEKEGRGISLLQLGSD